MTSVQNRVVVNLSVKDDISKHLRSVKGGFDVLRGAGNGILGVFTQMAISADGIATTLGAVSKLFSGIGAGMKGEISALSAANSLSVVMKLDPTEAKATINQLQTELATSAAKMPGSAEDYASAAGQYAAVVGGIAKDTQDFISISKRLATNSMVLAEGSGADKSQAAAVTSRLLSGSSSLSELKRNDAFEKDPLLRNALSREFKASGLSETKTGQDPKAILRAYLAATDSIITPQYLSDLTNTAKAQLDSLKDSLFSPRIGIFGFLRKIEFGDNRGRTGLDSINTLLKSVTYLGEQAAKALKTLGFDVDPMDVIIDIADWFSSLANGFSGVFKTNLSVKELVGSFSRSVVFALENVTQTIKNINWVGVGSVFGESIARILLDPALGKALEDGLTTALNGLAQLIASALQSAFTEFGDDLGKSLVGQPSKIKLFEEITPPKVLAESASPTEKYWNALQGVFPILKNIGKSEEQPLSSLSGNTSSYNNSSQQVAYNTFNISGANMNPQELMTAINSEYTRYKEGILA